MARDIVLRSIRDAIPSGWRERQAELRALGDVSLAEYLEHTGLELEDVYAGNHSWTELRRSAGLATEPAGSDEVSILRAVGRLLHVDDDERVAAYLRLVRSPEPPDVAELELRDQRWLRMLVASLTTLGPRQPFSDAVEQLWAHPQVRAELGETFELLRGRADHLHEPIGLGAAIPLSVHARYTRNEILAAFGSGVGAKPATWQTGVYWDAASQSDLFAFTLGQECRWVFANNPVPGLCDQPNAHPLGEPICHVGGELDGTALHRATRRANECRYVRAPSNDERAFWCLGRASYVSHEGNRPIAFRWQLASPLPGDLYSAFAAAVA